MPPDSTASESRSPIVTTVREPSELVAADRERLFALMAAYFDGVDRSTFFLDLDEKEWVFVLRDAHSGTIEGFSTLRRLAAPVDGSVVHAFFTGDTILSENHLGYSGWLADWGRHVFAIRDAMPEPKVYWLLLTSTYRSYRFLPAFFREYYPKPDVETPPEIRRTVAGLAEAKFEDEFDERRGVVKLSTPTPHRYPPRPPARRKPDPHIEYFFEANPGYVNSDFLCCLAELSRENLTRLGRRVLGSS